MNDEEIRAICTKRLGRWQQALEHEHATPLVLIGVGHDDKKGQLVISITQEMPLADIILFLEGALRIIRAEGV